jgi:hypothetical protein
MPLDCLEFVKNPLLEKLGKVERLLATEQQWCKGKLRDVDGRRCLVGAIEAADAQHELPQLILRATREVTGKRYWRIESFNDDPRTKHRDVLLVLRRTRQNILNQMAEQCDPQPWYRKWAQSLWASRRPPCGTSVLRDLSPMRPSLTSHCVARRLRPSLSKKSELA